MAKINFNEELAQLQKQLELDEKDNMATQPESQTSNVAKKLIDIIVEESNGTLTYAQIDEWKQMYNNKVYAIRFDAGESYIFRYVSRLEMKAIISQVQKATKNVTDDYLDELLFDRCVLYPKVTPDIKNLIGAGTISTIAEQIRIQSNYLPPEVAIQLVQKL